MAEAQQQLLRIAEPDHTQERLAAVAVDAAERPPRAVPHRRQHPQVVERLHSLQRQFQVDLKQRTQRVELRPQEGAAQQGAVARRHLGERLQPQRTILRFRISLATHRRSIS